MGAACVGRLGKVLSKLVSLEIITPNYASSDLSCTTSIQALGKHFSLTGPARHKTTEMMDTMTCSLRVLLTGGLICDYECMITYEQFVGYTV